MRWLLCIFFEHQMVFDRDQPGPTPGAHPWWYEYNITLEDKK
jgi:hypothetical protein